MDVDDLLDLAACHGERALRPVVDRLSRRDRADLRDLLALAHYGYSDYADPALAPRQLARRRPRTTLAEAVHGTTYNTRPGAVAAGRKVQQDYTKIEIVQNLGTGQWEVHYDDPVPKGTTPFDDTRTFATKGDGIPRARTLRAYGYTVVIEQPPGKPAFCRVASLTGTVGLPTATGYDTGFVYPSFDRADVRANALRAVGFGAEVRQRTATTYQVEILALPTFTTTATSATTHTVKAGDTLYGIASKHGVTVAELKRANKLTSNTINVGDRLVIPARATAAPPPPKPPPPPPPSPSPSPVLASSSVGHDPRGDWSTGVTRKDVTLRKDDRVTKQTSGSAELVLPKNTAITRKRVIGTWVEVEGTAYEQKPRKALALPRVGTGWIPRDATSMSLGVFKDLPVDDRTATYGALTTKKAFGAGNVTNIVLHQTQSTTGASTLGTYKTRIVDGSTRGAHYLIDERGTVILVVPIDMVVSHATGFNEKSIGIEHVGMPTALDIPASATDTTAITALRASIAALPMSPKLQARIAAMSDKKMFRFAKDAKEPGVAKWYLYGDINALQKRASWLLVQRLRTHFALGAAAVVAHEAVAAKSPGEGENIAEYLAAREAYPASVASLATVFASESQLLADPALQAIVSAEIATVDALKVDATAPENAAVKSGTDAAATKRQALRDAFYTRFWAKQAQLDRLLTFLRASGASNPAKRATLTSAWIF